MEEKTKKEKQYVVGLGEVLLDRFLNNKGEEIKTKLGGAPTIFAYHAAKSGWDGLVISAIGKDEEGKKIRKELKNHNLKSRLKTIEGKRSGVVDVDNSDCNKPSYKIDRNSACFEMPFTIDDIKIDENDKKEEDKKEFVEIAGHTKAVYFGTLASFCSATTNNKIDGFLNIVPDDCLKIYDVNFRKNSEKDKLYNKRLVGKYVEKCNVLKVNLEELEYIYEKYPSKDPTSTKNPGEMKKCKTIMKHFPNIDYLILTMGEDGSTIFWKDKEHDNRIAFSSLGMPLDVKNTVGAGDALAGAFIGEILRGRPEVHAHRIAVERSAVVCVEGDSMPPINKYDVFISYAHKDKKLVSGYFVNRFKDEQLSSIWIDEQNIKPGDDFPVEIKNAIRDSEVFLFFYSKDSNKSDWVQREIKYALEYKKIIIPVLLDDLEKEPNNENNEMYDELLNNIEYVDCSIFNKLIISIKEKLEIQST